MRRFLVAFAALTSGCDLYFDGGDDECRPIAEPAFAPESYRDPNTGDCQDFDCDPRCDDSCAPTAQDLALPDWGSCYSACEGLAANQCMATAGCYAAFYDWPTRDRTPEYRACFQTAPSGPVGGSCANLDAQQCSRHDNCIAFYEGPETRDVRTPPVRSTYLSCAPEPLSTTCAAADCAPGTHCEDQCDASGHCKAVCEPDVNVCAGVDCGPGWAGTQVCDGDACGAQCVPDGACEAITTENACKTRPDCTTVYLGDNCTCTPNGGCTCEILTYDRCETN